MSYACAMNQTPLSNVRHGYKIKLTDDLFDNVPIALSTHKEQKKEQFLFLSFFSKCFLISLIFIDSFDFPASSIFLPSTWLLRFHLFHYIFSLILLYIFLFSFPSQFLLHLVLFILFSQLISLLSIILTPLPTTLCFKKTTVSTVSATATANNLISL